jgi:hypothetical protein
MPGQIRQRGKPTKIDYRILKTPKDKRQDKQNKPNEKMIREWEVDSYQSQ